MYFIDKDKIKQNQGEIQLSNWLELSENGVHGPIPTWPQRSG
jgi:hypothetical protein